MIKLKHVLSGFIVIMVVILAWFIITIILAEWFCDKGVAFYNKGMYSEAMICYNRAIEMNSTYSKAFSQSRLCLRIGG